MLGWVAWRGNVFDSWTVYLPWAHLFEIELFICIKMDLVLNNLQTNKQIDMLHMHKCKKLVVKMTWHWGKQNCKQTHIPVAIFQQWHKTEVDITGMKSVFDTAVKQVKMYLISMWITKQKKKNLHVAFG